MSYPDEGAYLVEKIIPRKRVHLVAGISSAGKSRFLVPALIMYSAGMPFCGLHSFPVKTCMVCRDRPLSDAEDMLDTMGFNSSDILIIPAFGSHARPDHQIISEVLASGAHLVLWEGFDMMVKSPNNPHEVGEFLSKMTAYCQDEDLTIIGTVGVAKLKPHEMYQNPRQLVAGSSIWERATSTNLIITAVNPRDISDPRRLLYVSLKNAPSFQLAGRFDDNGILVFDDYANRQRGADLALSLHKKRNGTNGKS